MEALSDLTWLRQLSLSAVERFELHGFGIAVVSMTPTAAHHEERYRYRLLAFDHIHERPTVGEAQEIVAPQVGPNHAGNVAGRAGNQNTLHDRWHRLQVRRRRIP